MSDPLTAKAQPREYVDVGNGSRLSDVLSGSEVPPEVRIADRACGGGKDHDHEKQHHEPWTSVVPGQSWIDLTRRHIFRRTGETVLTECDMYSIRKDRPTGFYSRAGALP
jgi:hypothetical protein